MRVSFEFFFSLGTLLPLLVAVFCFMNYLDLRFTQKVKVTGQLEGYVGPWQRIRGGQDELFVKLYYTYSVNGTQYQNKREVTFENGLNLEQFLASNKHFEFLVNESDPLEIMGIQADDWRKYFIGLVISSFVLFVRFFRTQIKPKEIKYE